MDQLLINLQAAQAALRMARPNQAQWSGPAATAFSHRVDLLEIEFTVLCGLVTAASAMPVFGGSPVGKLPGGFSPVVPLEQLLTQLGIHF